MCRSICVRVYVSEYICRSIFVGVNVSEYIFWSMCWTLFVGVYLSKYMCRSIRIAVYVSEIQQRRYDLRSCKKRLTTTSDSDFITTN
jgi:hypothetical protein